MGRFRLLLDRTAVLFLGVAAGGAIGYAFATGNARHEAVALAPEAAPVVGQAPAVAPPPPTAPAAPASPEEKPAAAAAPVEAAPAVPDQPPAQIADAVRDGRTIRVGVFGDSFGDGVYSALYRLLPASAGYQVAKYSQPSTGFTRYRRLNLEQHDEAQIGAEPIDVAVISFGANDAQGVCDGEHCGKLMSAFWQEVIAKRVESYVAMLRRHGASVYWVGMPAMRDGAFDTDTRAMDAFYASQMQRLGVPFIDIRPLTVDGDGRYQDYYRDGDGTPKLLRAGDGVHMSMNGYIRVSKSLAARIRATIDAARMAKSGEAPADNAQGAL